MGGKREKLERKGYELIRKTIKEAKRQRDRDR